MRILYTLALAAFASILAGCSNNSSTNSTKTQAILEMKRATDHHSFSKPNEAIVNHLEWDAKVDFDTRTIEATATYSITTSKDAERIILDIRELNISSVRVDSKEASYEIGEEMPFIGSPLAINITPANKREPTMNPTPKRIANIGVFRYTDMLANSFPCFSATG